ncbi:unnamed protein product [Darwinula stevensoni]|uniref:TOG domain-containing protein n=1 Tax=Darwinula stevensoni TaxID=69355 RepID=A0A7R9A901_9CRUS|nr:unnamed protein product [Darwinula stevensoni]CAG0896905.1 unnamed protein product [Darwinula stevensoni]
MASLDEFYERMQRTNDTKSKLTLSSDIASYLSVPSSSVECEDLGLFVDEVASWLNISNFKLCQTALEILNLLVLRLRDDFRPYLSSLLPQIVDRLGDQKDVVRSAAQTLLSSLMEHTSSPQVMLEKMNNSFSHKNGKIREELLVCLQNALNRFGSSALSLSKLVPAIIKLLGDPAAPVREAALMTLIVMYRHVGERLRLDLTRKHNVPPAKMQLLNAKFDEEKASGNLMPTATLSLQAQNASASLLTEMDEEEVSETPRNNIGRCHSVSKAPDPEEVWGSDQEWILLFDSLLRHAGKRIRECECHPSQGFDPHQRLLYGRGEDECDRASVRSLGSNGGKRASSAPPVRRTSIPGPKGASAGMETPAPPAGPNGGSGISIPTSSSGASAGAVDEDSFMAAFEDVPRVQIVTSRDLDENLNRIREIIGDTNNDWNKRLEAIEVTTWKPFWKLLQMKRMRGVLLSGGGNPEDVTAHVRLLIPSFQLSVKDLRSQVVREACITIAFLAQQLGSPRLDQFAEALLPHLINLIPNSAKVGQGIVAIRFIVQHVHSARLIPIITSSIGDSKSKEIRRSMCEFLAQVLATWPTPPLERHLGILQEALKKGIADPDAEARAFARRFMKWIHVFIGIGCRAYWAFADHFREQANILLNTLDASYKRVLKGELTGGAGGSASRPASRQRSHGNSTSGSMENLAKAPQLPRRYGALLPSPYPPATSETDSPRIPYPAPSPSVRSNSTLDLQAAQRAKARQQYSEWSRMKATTTASFRGTPPCYRTADRSGRTRTRGAGVSHSQPGSRSGSPSSRLTYLTPLAIGGESATLGRPPRSTQRKGPTTRSAATSRETSPGPRVGRSRSIGGDSISKIPVGRSPMMAQKILLQSREAENALESALQQRSPRRRNEYSMSAFDDHSDDSETSSMCSERSFDSYAARRASDRDVGEIIACCASTHWADRKEGLLGLQRLLRSNRMLTHQELRRVTDAFAKMFTDPHTKVFTLFLDTLQELILVHKEDLQDWLYVLLTRLFNKLGADLLNSILSKINKILDLIRDSFPMSLQLNVIMRFLADVTQTPNSKVKLATLRYAHLLLASMSSQDFRSSPDMEAAVKKLVSWTHDPKSRDVSSSARHALCCMFDLNPADFTLLMSRLPKQEESAIKSILEDSPRPRRTTMDNSYSSPGSPFLRFSSPMHSPGMVKPLARRGLSMDDTDTENMNPEEVYSRLQATSTQIQNSFKVSDNTSRDSGISQVSEDVAKCDTEKMAGDALQSHSSQRHFGSMLSDQSNVPDGSAVASGEYLKGGMTRILSELNDKNQRLTGLKKLRKLLEEPGTTSGSGEVDGETSFLVSSFKGLLRLLLECLQDQDMSVRVETYAVFLSLLQRQALIHLFMSYTELLILKMLEGHKDPSKEVSHLAEVCAGTIAGLFQADTVVRVLNPLIQTGEYPVNNGALKMLTRVAEQHDKEAIFPFLPDVMPGLIQAYDNEESSVRKSAVFCLVALHYSVGQDVLQPYLAALNVSKRKLLNLYIRRKQILNSKQNSESSSPRASPANSQ